MTKRELKTTDTTKGAMSFTPKPEAPEAPPAIEPEPVAKPASNETFSKTIKKIPLKHKEEFQRLKAMDKVNGSLDSYIRYALAQQLKRDAE